MTGMPTGIYTVNIASAGKFKEDKMGIDNPGERRILSMSKDIRRLTNDIFYLTTGMTNDELE